MVAELGINKYAIRKESTLLDLSVQARVTCIEFTVTINSRQCEEVVAF
jgi:hypothetical protein